MTSEAQQRRLDLERKIRALLKKAESTNFEAEAASFIAKAQELMIRHSIDEETLWKNDPDKAEQIEEKVIKIAGSQMGSRDKRILLNHIAGLSNCQSWWMSDTDDSVVCGYTSDVLWVEILFASIVTQAQFKQAVGLAVNDGRVHTKVFKSNWWAEFVRTVSLRLTEAYRVARQNSSELPMLSGTPGHMDLVLKNRKERVADYVNGKYRFKTTSNRRTGTYNHQARVLGRMAGNEVDVSAAKAKMGNRKELPK